MNNSEQEFKCVFCHETLPTKEELQDHFRKHADPNFKHNKAKGRAQIDAEDSGEKQKDQIEMVECDVCPEMFTSISKAITHKHKAHPDHDTKYFCPWCGKLFTMKYLYNKHLKSAHSNIEASDDDRCFHCDTCDVDFIHAAMVYHNKFYHRQEELPIIGHSKKFKMATQEMVQIYYCPFCGEEFDNKVNLHKHMTDDHSDENQSPEEVLRCPLCDAIFYHLDAYELHLTYHSVEDLYAERNPLIEETTDFSLETVQPLREKIENADAPTMGIEDFLEFTMNDNASGKKSKKHKKHKKSKKAAITLDEFLSMNKDVFGEGIDFQGVEEVPSQVVAKRLKTKKVPTKVMTSDLAKLKKQGIVVKKQSNVGKTKVININKATIPVIKTVNSNKPQAKVSKLTSTDAVLSKLLNQGSQIKILKKPNQEEQSQPKDNNIANDDAEKNDEEEHLSDNVSTEKDKKNDEEYDKNTEGEEAVDKEPDKATLDAQNSAPGSPNAHNNTNLNKIENSAKICNNSNQMNISADVGQKSEKSSTCVDSLNALRNNSNIAIKNSKENVTPVTDEAHSESFDNDDHHQETSERNPAEEDVQNNERNEKPGLDAFKHLSHLITIKPVSQGQKSPIENKKLDNGSPAESKAKQITQSNASKQTELKSKPYVKNLSEITIKPSVNIPKQQQSSVNTIKTEPEHETDDEFFEDDDNTQNKKNVEKIAHMLKNPHLSIQTKQSPLSKEKDAPKVFSNENSRSGEFVKHFKNITMNPVISNNQKIQTPKSSPSTLQMGTVAKTTVKKEITDDGEIFSIDDSDSDEGNNCKNYNSTIKPTTVSKIETNKSYDVLKNINKNITIKSNKIERQVNQPCDSGDDFDVEDDDESIPRKSLNNVNSPKINQNQAVHNVLKTLGKNITVKSRNSSPSQSVRSHDHNSRDSRLEEANDALSDTDPVTSPRVKITEIENTSDGEFPEDHEESDLQDNVNVKVQHPDDSHSDHDEFMDDEFEDLDDLESQITTSTVHKTPPKQANNRQIIRNDMKVKSPHHNASTDKSETLPSEDIPNFPKNLGNQISIKPIKKPENKSIKQVPQIATHSSNQSQINQKVASSSNKEVKTVSKTYRTQTETVIEEITTTVTKTIKTVNQTTKQEVRNMSQSSSTSKMPQKIQGFNSNIIQNFQGIKVRQAPPVNVRPKIRGPPPQIVRPAICGPQMPRPAICAPPVRASNQLVPVRPGPNRPRGPRPRLPNVMNVRASTSGQQRPQLGKQVKISPGAVISSPKRPAEAAGHFSCFKKPKESLIPVPDFSEFSNNDGESVQCSSAVHMSKSNFSSTTKTVKGNSVVTSTKMKSEMSARSQQLSKLQGMSGLSVVKTSQAKQSHVEEHSEMSASKRNTLEAIQKLQNQGLLVKKPRLDVNEDSAHSPVGSDDNMGHDSNEEFDEFE